MSGLTMPKADAATLARPAEIVADMKIIVSGEGVVMRKIRSASSKAAG